MPLSLHMWPIASKGWIVPIMLEAWDRTTNFVLGLSVFIKSSTLINPSLEQGIISNSIIPFWAKRV